MHNKNDHNAHASSVRTLMHTMRTSLLLIPSLSQILYWCSTAVLLSKFTIRAERYSFYLSLTALIIIISISIIAAFISVHTRLNLFGLICVLTGGIFIVYAAAHSIIFSISVVFPLLRLGHFYCDDIIFAGIRYVFLLGILTWTAYRIPAVILIQVIAVTALITGLYSLNTTFLLSTFSDSYFIFGVYYIIYLVLSFNVVHRFYCTYRYSVHTGMTTVREEQ